MSAGERVSTRTLVAFGVPAAGVSFYLMFAQFYFLKFATDVLLLAPAAIGALFGIGRIWDAVLDPVAGTWSDRTRTRLGRRRPWMWAGVPLLAVTFAMIWRPPTALEGSWLLAWCGVALFGFYTAYTVYSIPHLALGAELSSDHHERSRIFGAQRGAFILGMMLAFGGIQVVTTTDTPRTTTGSFALLAVVAVSAMLVLAPALLRERPGHRSPAATGSLGALRDVMRNPHARTLLVVWFVESLGGGVLGVLAPYLSEYVLERPDLIGVIPAFFVLPGVAAIPGWVVLSRRIGKRAAWMLAMIGTGSFFGATFFVDGPEDVAWLCALLVGAGACYGCGGTLGQSILADVIDHDELETGERREGAYTAAFSFVLKLAIGVTVMATGVALQVVGFVPNEAQSDDTRRALSALFAGLPFAGYGIGALLFRRFSLTGDAHAAIREALERRVPGRSGGGS